MLEKILLTIKKYLPRRLFRALQPIYHFTLSYAAALYYRFPSERLIVIGVTGTTGKTTSVYLIAKTLEQAGFKVGYSSTAMFNDGRLEWMNDKKMTMVGRFYTQRLLKSMVDNGCRVAIVEATSEGVRQYRHRFINFDLLVFTGLYPEHIESHGGFENYKQAKGRLFAHLKQCRVKFADDAWKIHITDLSLKKLEMRRIKKTIIANLDDEHADYFLGFWAERKLGYHLSGSTMNPHIDTSKIDITEYGQIRATARGTSFDIENNVINLQLLGAFNATNAMTAVCSAKALEVSLGDIKAGLESIESVAGRLEKIDEGQDFAVIVDYAFEPNAFRKLYEAVSVMPHERIIHVFGATGGGRDTARRPIMGQIAGENADLVVLTNDDPYDDDPEIIIENILLGAEKAGKVVGKDVFKIVDRREAIKFALHQANTGDIVLITGKGNEQYLVLANGEKIPWDDRAIARGLLHEKNKC